MLAVELRLKEPGVAELPASNSLYHPHLFIYAVTEKFCLSRFTFTTHERAGTKYILLLHTSPVTTFWEGEMALFMFQYPWNCEFDMFPEGEMLLTQYTEEKMGNGEK